MTPLSEARAALLREWMPHEYQDEVVPPARPSPNDWIVWLSDGAPALAGGDPFCSSDDDPGRALREGDHVLFDWVESYGERELTFKSTEEDGWTWLMDGDEPEPSAGGDMTVAEVGNWETMMPSLREFATEYGDKNDGETITIRFYAWSRHATEFEFRSGAFQAAGRSALAALGGGDGSV